MSKIPRSEASTFDEELFAEVQTAIGLIGGEKDSGVPADFDDELLGQNAKDAAEANYQRGQEIAVMAATLGWKYVVESLNKMVSLAQQAHEDSAVSTDIDILQTYREWKATDKVVKQIIANVDSAAMIPPPTSIDERRSIQLADGGVYGYGS